MHADSVAEAPSAGALILPDSLQALPCMLENLPEPSKVGGKAGRSVSVLHVVLDPSAYLPTGTHHCLQVLLPAFCIYVLVARHFHRCVLLWVVALHLLI